MSAATVPSGLVADLTRAVMDRKGRQLHSGEIRHTCPFPENHRNGDADPSCRWNPDKGTFYCDACHQGGGAFDLARALGFALDNYMEPLTARSSSATNGHAKLRPHDRFLVERRLPASIFRDFDVRITSVDDRPALVYPTGAGDRVKFLDGGKPKARWLVAGEGSQTLYNLDKAVALLDAGAWTVYLVNGEPSVWACHAAGIPAITLCTGEQAPHRHIVDELSATLAALNHPVTVAIAYDTDATGAAGSMAALDVLGEAGLPACIVRLPKRVSDVDDLHRIHGGRLGDALAALPVLARHESIHDSRSLKGSGIVNDAEPPRIVRVWECPDPPKREYALEGIVPDGAITALYGDGGQGKSLLALFIASCMARGVRCFDRDTVRRPVLYVDAELEQGEFARRAYQVARGMGYVSPPEDLYYLRLPGSLADIAVAALVDQAREAIGQPLVMIDSLMAACFGSDLEGALDTTRMMKIIERWGTVLTIDHIAKPQPGANLSHYRQFGSVFKYNLSRSVLQLIQADGGGLLLRQTKHNFGPKSEPIGITLDFTGDAVTITTVATTDDRFSGIDDHLPAADQVARVLDRNPDGITPDAIAAELGKGAGTVRNHLTTLKQRGRAESAGGGLWKPIHDSRSVKEPGIVNPLETCWACGSDDLRVHEHNGNTYCNRCFEPLLKDGVLITPNGAHR